MTKDAQLPLLDIRLDSHGFHDVFSRYYQPLCLFAFQYVEDRELAADIVQECLAKLWQIRGGFLYDHQVKSYLYIAVRNKALNELEHRRVQSDYADMVRQRSQELFFDNSLVEQETYRLLFEAIDNLPPRMREVILLVLEGKKNAEIARQMNDSVETVRTLRKLAYQKLRVALKDPYYCLLLLGLQLPS